MCSMCLLGAAMAPTLNTKAKSSRSGDSAVDRLLMRCLPRASLRTVFSGDVVAFNSPLASGSGSENIMVRRVAAVEGDELITDDPADASYTVPEGAHICSFHTDMVCSIDYSCGCLWVCLILPRRLE